MIGDLEEVGSSSEKAKESFTSPVAKYRKNAVATPPDFGSPKELELSNSLSNLKWGFKRRYTMKILFIVCFLMHCMLHLFRNTEKKHCWNNLLFTKKRCIRCSKLI